MFVPGQNLLNLAFAAIAQQEIAYYQWSGRTTNDIGIDVDTFAPPITLRGSLQAVPKSRYANLNLDWQKQYINFFCPRFLQDIARDASGDLIQYAGKLYKVESLTDWYNQDGWVQALAVLTDSTVPDPSTYVVTPGTVFIVEPQ